MTELGDVVSLIEHLPDRPLRAGVQGTIVHGHGESAYEVEFTNDQGETLEWLAVTPTQFIVVWQARHPTMGAPSTTNGRVGGPIGPRPC